MRGSPGRRPAWPAQPWSAQPGAGRPGQGPTYPGQAGWPGYTGGPAPRRRPGAGGGAGRAILVVGLILLGLLALLLVPALIHGPKPTGSTGASGSNSAARKGSGGGSAASGHARTPTPAPAPVASDDAIPSDFAGTWSGRATQLGGIVKQWSAVLDLPGGAATGKMAITTIGCSATVTVTQADRNHVVLNETVVSDPAHKCAPAGTITLRHLGAGRVLMFWQQAGHPLNTATGLLDRA